MEQNSTPSDSQASLTHGKVNLFQQVQWVILVGIVVATLFTAWTEPGLLPSSLADQFSIALGTQATPLPPYPTPTARTMPHIGLVAGHSGNDPGAVCSEVLGGIREVDINLDVANRVRNNLLAEGLEVDLLSEFDPLLNGYQALALISIHSDSCDYINDQATGYKVAAAMSTTYPETAVRLTNCLSERYKQTTGMKFHAGSVTNDMTQYHAFDEISPNTPAAIIEIGFMNLDYEMLTQHPDEIARGITDGILCYVRNESVSPQNQP
jgi:N-acetylmuramoyl-L-alanine amidase